jgi:TP901 family phage tail tape measure protein
MAEEVLIKFVGDTGGFTGPLKAVNTELKTFGDALEKMRNQGKTAYLENSKGATQLAQTLGTSLKNAKEFAASIGLSGQAATQAAQRLGELDRVGASTTEKFRALRAEFGLSKSAFQSLNATIDQNTRSQQALAQTLGINLAAARNFAKDIGLSAEKANSAVERYRELSAVGATLAEKQRVLTQELGLTDKQFTAIRGSALATSEGLGAIAGIAGGVAAALGAIGAKGIQVFTEFDAVIRQFGVISESSSGQVAVVRDEIERLGTSTTKTPKQVAELGVELAKAGFRSKQVADSLGGIVLASQATGEDLQRTGEVIGNIINQFGLAARDSNKIADLLVATSNASASGVNDLGEALAYTGTQAAQSGQSLQDTLFALGQLANAGIRGSAAGTGLAEALRRLKLASANASTELDELRSKGSKTAVEAFKKLDQGVRGANGQLLPLPQILKNLQNGLKDVSQVDKDLINNALFGVQGGRVIQTLINSNAEQTQGLAAALGNAEGAAKRAGDALSQGPQAALQRLQAASDVALASIGGFLINGFLPMIDASEALLFGFNALPAPLQGAVVAIGSVAAGLAAAVAAMTAYKLLNAEVIVQQAIASAALLKDTIVRGASTAATVGQAVASGALATSLGILNTQISISAIATRAMAVSQTVVAAATAAWAAVTNGALIPSILKATASMGGLIAASLPFLALAAAIGGAVILMQEAFRKTDQEKFAADIRASTDEVRKLRGEIEKPSSGNLFDGLAESYDLFGKRIQEGGVISALQKTIADLSATLGLGADAADKFGQQWAFITREQLGAQQATLALDDRLNESAKVTDDARKLIEQYGLATVNAADKTRLGVSGIQDYNKAAAEQIKSIEAEIEALTKLSKASNDPQAKASLDAQINALQNTKDALQARSRALTNDAEALKTNTDKTKEAETAAERLKTALGGIKGIGEGVDTGLKTASQAESELNQLVDAENGRVEVRRAASKEILKIREAEIKDIADLLKSGEITEEQSIERLNAIQIGSTNKGAIKAASDETLKIRKDRIDGEIALMQAGTAAINAEVEAGTKSQAQAEVELTQLKTNEIEKRIAANQLELANATKGSDKAKLTAQAKQLEAEKTKLQAEAAEKRRKQVLEDFDEQLKISEASYAKGLISEDDYLRQKQQLQTQQADTEIAQLQEKLGKLSATDKEGREAITAKIAEVEIKRAKIQEDAQNRYLAKLKETQDKALDIIDQSNKQRLISIQQAENAGTITAEQADQQRQQSNLQATRAELQAARDRQAQLEKIETKGLGAEAAKKLEEEKRAARKQTTDLTLKGLEAEGAAIKARRDAAIKAIEEEGAAKVRAIDEELRGIQATQAARQIAASQAEAASQRQIAALEAESQALDRQSALLTARANLQKAQANADFGAGQIEVDNMKRAIELRKRLDSSNSDVERLAIAQQLAALGIDQRTSQLDLLRQQQAGENRLAQQRRAAILEEQKQAQAQLKLEIQKNDLANRRQLIEAQIAETKAKAAIIDAQIAQQEQERAAQRAITEAQTAQARAKQSGDRRAIAEADAQLAAAEQQARLGADAASNSLALAQQQAELARQNTAETQKSVESQKEINDLLLRTQQIEQQSALRQFDAAEAARQQGQALEQATTFANMLAAAAEREAVARERSARAIGGQSAAQPQTIQPRFAGGEVKPGQLYTMAERGAELIKFAGGKSALVERPGLYTVPSSGYVYTAARTRRMLATPSPFVGGMAASDRALINEMRHTRSAIERRKQLPPAQITVERGDDRQVERLLRTMIRSSL